MQAQKHNKQYNMNSFINLKFHLYYFDHALFNLWFHYLIQNFNSIMVFFMFNSIIIINLIIDYYKLNQSL